MNEEKHDRQRQTNRTRPNHKRSVTNYLMILFAAAIVLLLFSYLMQQRSTSEQALSGIQQSISAMQSAQDLYEENSSLKDEINTLDDQIDQLEDQLSQVQDKIDRQNKENNALQQQVMDLQKSNQAMDWFWQIDEAYVLGRYTLCRELITQLNAAGLTEFLPRSSITANRRFSPYDRYQEIYDALY